MKKYQLFFSLISFIALSNASVIDEYIASKPKNTAEDQYHIAVSLARGDFILSFPPDTDYDESELGEKAIFWYKESANNGYAPAQFALAIMYEEGEDEGHYVEANIDLAIEWYKKSCDNGSKEGCNALKRLNSK